MSGGSSNDVHRPSRFLKPVKEYAVTEARVLPFIADSKYVLIVEKMETATRPNYGARYKTMHRRKVLLRCATTGRLRDISVLYFVMLRAVPARRFWPTNPRRGAGGAEQG